ncbi:MAG: hypothetical protein ACI8PV_001819 [Dinoroseobacter sp.]|jgi:hypothetical protein|tara:strand:+ start:342 stop:566 length:225 start_codon:yes stop_codon:yes gene_type:complete
MSFAFQGSNGPVFIGNFCVNIANLTVLAWIDLLISAGESSIIDTVNTAIIVSQPITFISKLISTPFFIMEAPRI